MARNYVWPEGHWSWPIPVTHKHGVRAGEMIFVGGQVDLTPEGEVLHKGDPLAQTDATMANMATVLAALDADMDDVTRLVAFYVNDGTADEAALLARIRAPFGGAVPPALTLIPLPTLAYPDLAVEIEAVAMRGRDGARMARTASNPADHWDWPFSHGVRCGDHIFVGTQMPLAADGSVLAPGDPVEQARINIENLRQVLAGFGAELDDTCRINTFYVGHGTAEDWSRAAEIRGNAFKWPGPVGTGVPVPNLFPEGLTIRQEAWAMRGADGARLAREAVRPEGHWDWPIPVNFQQGVKVGNMIFVGGQVDLTPDGKARHAGDIVTQTRETLRFIRDVMTGHGAKMDDAVKVITFYKGGASYDHLHENLSIRSAAFSDPGPATTGIPLEALGVEKCEIEIEIYAMTE